MSECFFRSGDFEHGESFASVLEIDLKFVDGEKSSEGPVASGDAFSPSSNAGESPMFLGFLDGGVYSLIDEVLSGLDGSAADALDCEVFAGNALGPEFLLELIHGDAAPFRGGRLVVRCWGILRRGSGFGGHDRVVEFEGNYMCDERKHSGEGL